MLAKLKIHLEWLYQETLKDTWNGMSRAAIHHQNLMPPFIHQNPEVHFPFLVMRENVINRIYDQNIGYWQPDLQGMDHLSQEEFGLLLTHYLERSEPQLVSALENMLESGDHALAARTTTWALTQYPSSAKLQELRKMAFLKQREIPRAQPLQGYCVLGGYPAWNATVAACPAQQRQGGGRSPNVACCASPNICTGR